MRNYLLEMLDALTSAYSRKDADNRKRGSPVETNIGKLFSIFAWGLNMVHEQAERVKQWDNIDNAQGSVLDRYGANFGVKRFGADDAFYRLMIKVKMLSQLSGGDTDTVINAAAELLGVQPTDILLEDVFPAKIWLYLDQMTLSDDRLQLIEPIAQAIKRIIAAGVGMRLYLRTYRTYRHDLLIGHAGAVGAILKFQIIGEDREASWEVPVSYGGAVATDCTYPPVGEDRVARSDVAIGHAGFAEAISKTTIIGEDRMIRSSIPVSHASFEKALAEPGIVGKDRELHTSVPMSHGGVVKDIFEPTIIGEDHVLHSTVPVAHGSFMPTRFSSDTPDVSKTVKGRQKSGGGAYMQVHIKPKRID